MKLKLIAFIFLFIVTWKEYELKKYWDAQGRVGEAIYYKVELTKKSIFLETEQDVERFTGYGKPDRDGERILVNPHIAISPNAFDIEINERK